MRIIKLPVFIGLLCSFLAGCEEEAASLPQENPETNMEPTIFMEFQNAHSWDLFNDPDGLLKDNLQIDWEEYTSNEIDGNEWYEFAVREQRPFSYQDELVKGYNYYVAGP